MKKYLLIPFLAIAFGGCATQSQIRSINERLDGISKRCLKSIENGTEAHRTLGRDIDSVNYSINVETGYRRDQDRILDKKISALESFKADHDKRWPPEGKLKEKAVTN